MRHTIKKLHKHIKKHIPEKMPMVVVFIAFAFVGYLLISPIIFPKKVYKLNIPSDMVDKPSIVGIGEFIGLNGHKTEGSVTIYKTGEKYYLRMEDNFGTVEGIQLAIYLGMKNNYVKEAEIDLLKNNTGSQNFDISENIDVSKYDTIWIINDISDIPFGKAPLVLME